MSTKRSHTDEDIEDVINALGVDEEPHPHHDGFDMQGGFENACPSLGIHQPSLADVDVGIRNDIFLPSVECNEWIDEIQLQPIISPQPPPTPHLPEDVCAEFANSLLYRPNQPQHDDMGDIDNLFMEINAHDHNHQLAIPGISGDHHNHNHQPAIPGTSCQQHNQVNLPVNLPDTSNNEPQVMLGGGGDDDTHSVERVRYHRSKKFRTQSAHFKIKLKNLDGKTYQEVCHNFHEIMRNILDDVLKGVKGEDMVRFNIHSSRFDTGDLNTPFQTRSSIAPDRITALIDHTMQSNSDINMEDDFILNIIHVDIPAGRGGQRRMYNPNMAANIIQRRSSMTGFKDWFLKETDPDIHCFAYALQIVVRRLTQTYLQVRGWSRSRNLVIEGVADYHTRAGVPPGVVTPEHYQSFQNILPDGVRLVVVDAMETRGLLYKGESGDRVVALLYHNQHYTPLKSVASWFGQTYYCVECEVGTNLKSSHKCKSQYDCRRCLSKRCLKLPKLPKYCRDCCGMFSNPECFQEHISNAVCRTSSSCEVCSRWFPREVVRHQCATVVCSYCNKIHKEREGCFITPPTDTSKPDWRTCYFDFETTQTTQQPDEESKEHVVNFAVAMSHCSKCTSNAFCDVCSIPVYFSGLHGGNAINEFCFWATSNPLNHNTTFIAHNASGYDTHFILKYLVEEGNTPNVVMQGGKILSLSLSSTKTRFIDSLSFLTMPLASFTKTFDIPDKMKGTFPHLFNTPANYDYDGLLPPLHYYSPDSMKADARRKLLEWHADHSSDRFVFADELKAYCEADVDLLRAGCMKFRNSFISSTGVDPFAQMTIASACMAVFRRNHLKANTIGRIPVEGYRSHRNFSHSSMGWITWMERKHNAEMRHAWHPAGEKYLPDAHVWADGFVEETGSVLCYLGCFYHGHLECKKNPYSKTTFNPKLKMSMGDLDLETQRWLKRVQQCNYKIEKIYDCQWQEEIALDEEKRAHVESMGMAGGITPRSALYGGRTEAFCLYAQGDRDHPIKYIDVVSLYPFVCKWKKYPVGHPEIIIGPKLRGRSVEEFEGLVRCTVLPPKHLFSPLLPSKINGKLLFTLCRTCASLQQTVGCRHTSNQRALTETWVSMEVKKAVSLGYEVMKIHEVWHYTETTQYNPVTGEGGLFSSYMDTFITQKMEASGFPSDVNTPEEKTEFIQKIEKEEGIKLDPHKIEKNPGARAVAKLCLNNLWGKLGQRSNMAQHTYVRKPYDFFKLLCSDKYDVTECNLINEDCIYLSYKHSNGFEKPPPNTNAVIASYVTSHARLELYRYLELLGERVLYCDTDSVIYKSGPGDNHPSLSDAMGGMTDELGGSFIKEFTSNGAKTYGYRTDDGDEVLKCKGFTLNKLASDVITFDVMHQLATGDNNGSVTVEDPQKIIRDKKRRRICTVKQSKVYRRTFDKRILLENYTSIPYGYCLQ